MAKPNFAAKPALDVRPTRGAKPAVGVSGAKPIVGASGAKPGVGANAAAKPVAAKPSLTEVQVGPGSMEDCAKVPGGCHIGELFGLLSQAHMMDVLHTLIRAQGPVRFNELQTSLDVSPNTLSARLKALLEAGLITRTAHNTIPPRVDYAATAKARDLGTVFKALAQWAQRHSLEPVAAA